MKLKLFSVSLGLLLLTLLIPSLVIGAEAPKSIKLYLNDKQLKPEVSPQLIKGNTLVPVRIIAEELGAIVGWNEKDRKVTVHRDNLSMELTIDKEMVMVNGKKESLEVAPIIVEGNTLLPLRFIGEKMGAKFNWDGLSYAVHIFKQEQALNPVGPITNTSVEPKPTIKPAPESTVKPATSQPSPAPIVTQPASPSPSATSTAKPLPATSITPGETAAPSPAISFPVQGGGSSQHGDSKINLVQSIELTTTELIVRTWNDAVQPSVFKLSDPNRIVFDLPYATLDEPLTKTLVGNVGEIASIHPLVEKVRFSNYAANPATVRIILDLKQNAEYRINTSNPSNQFSAAILLESYKIVIDAGHGDTDPGAPTFTNKKEKEFTLALAKKIQALLSQDKRFEVLMTRSDDTFVGLDDRVALANGNKADLFLSIHGNSLDRKEIRGVETYYYRKDSKDFANMIHKNTVQATGFPDRRVRDDKAFKVIKQANMPAVLLEVGYLSNKEDEAAMFNEEFQERTAASIVAAIQQYLNTR